MSGKPEPMFSIPSTALKPSFTQPIRASATFGKVKAEIMLARMTLSETQRFLLRKTCGLVTNGRMSRQQKQQAEELRDELELRVRQQLRVEDGNSPYKAIMRCG